MQKIISDERVLAYKTAFLIDDQDLEKIGGGAATGTTQGSTKQTADNRGNWDVGVDVIWD